MIAEPRAKSQFKRWLFSPPRPHGQVLKDRTVSNLELFYDLVYVAVIGQASHHLAQSISLRSFVDDGGARLQQLLSRLGLVSVRIPKVHPAEISKADLETLGFRPAGGHLLYAARARSE